MAIQAANSPISTPTFKQAKNRHRIAFSTISPAIKTAEVAKLGVNVTSANSVTKTARVAVCGVSFDLVPSNNEQIPQQPLPTVGHIYPRRSR